VFTFTINANGSWVFNLEGQLDHPAGLNENNLSIDLSSLVKATDQDGDPATAASGALVVSVDDDLPVNNSTTLTPPTVHEDALNNSNAIGNPEGVGQTVNASISVAAIASLVNGGADQPITIGLNAAIEGVATGLTQGGVSIVWDFVSATQVRGVLANDPAHVVFTLTYDGPNSEYDFVLLDAIDHDADNNLATGEGDSAIETLSLDGVFTATDKDSDPVVINGGASINIENDVPQDIEPEDAVLEQLSSFTGDLDLAGPGGDLNGLVDNYGGDGPGTVRFPADLDGDDSGMKFGGVAIVYNVVDDHTLQGVAGGTVVFTITLDPANSQYTVDLDHKIDNQVNVDFTDTNFDFIGGNKAWFGIVPNGQVGAPVDDDSQDVLITPLNNTSINTSGILGGVDTGQSVGAGEGFRIDYVIDLTGSPPNNYTQGGTNSHTFNAGDTGTHWTTNGATVTMRQSTGSEVRFQAFDDTDADNIVGDGTQDTINRIVINYNGATSGDLIPTGTLQNITVGGVQFTYKLDADGKGVLIGNVQGNTGANETPATQVAIFTADGYTSMEVEHVSGDTFKFAGFGATTESEDPFDFSVPVEIVDADGDTADGQIDVTVYPVGNLPTLSLLSANDNQELQRTSTNTMIMAGALAAAGLSTEPLAAETRHDRADSHEDHGAKVDQQASLTVESKSEDNSKSVDVLDQPVAKGSKDAANDGGPSHDDAAAHKGVSNEDAPAPSVSELSQGTDAPTQGDAHPSAPTLAPTVAMPSAEQLAAATGELVADAKGEGVAGDDAGAKDVGKVLADALHGGGHGKDLDALINAVSGHDKGAQNAHEALASHGSGDVSNGDIAVLAGYHAMQGPDMMTQMTMHQDAAPAHA
jgi:hypothetical protein